MRSYGSPVDLQVEHLEDLEHKLCHFLINGVLTGLSGPSGPLCILDLSLILVIIASPLLRYTSIKSVPTWQSLRWEL